MTSNSGVRFTGFRPEHLKKLAGWSWDPIRRVFEDRQFGQAFHTLFWRDEIAQNDQMIHSERGPGCFIPLSAGGEIGLIQHAFRPQTRDMERYAKVLPHLTADELCETLGHPSWEIPRGYAELGESGMQAGAREGSEETASAVTAAMKLGIVCGNTAMDAHFMTVVAGLVDPTKMGLPGDKNEKLLRGLTFFSYAGIQTLISEGGLYCAFTLSGFQLLETHGGAEQVLKKLQAEI